MDSVVKSEDEIALLISSLAVVQSSAAADDDMGKIVHLSSSSSNSTNSFELKKHNKHVQVEQSDHITKLPDALLCSIVSHLTLTEAARTSVLSHRWKTLWHHFHGNLEFDAAKKIMFFPEKTRRQALDDYLTSMTQTLPFLSSPFLGSFIVRFNNLNKVCTSHIDLCVQFAMKKRMKSFELDTLPSPVLFETGRLYNFPAEFYAWIKSSIGLDNISSLTSICLNRVNISEDLIHHLLVNCPLLESLRVTHSPELLNPKFIGGTSLKLKYLKILGFDLESIEICAPNLLTFITESRKVKLLIKNAPKLVELSISVHVLYERFESVSSYLPHLERLTLDFSIGNRGCYAQLMPRFVEQNKLQHLTWELGEYHDIYTIKVNSMLEASPFLHTFTLVIFYESPSTEEMVPTVTAKHPHQCLKVIKIDGFTGADAEVKLVRYFLVNTTSLEEIILDTITPSFRETPWKGKSSQLRRSKLSALKLKKCLPPRVSLVILE